MVYSGLIGWIQVLREVGIGAGRKRRMLVLMMLVICTFSAMLISMVRCLPCAKRILLSHEKQGVEPYRGF